MRPSCLVCGREVGAHGVWLYLARFGGAVRDVWLCGPRCLARYNGEAKQ